MYLVVVMSGPIAVGKSSVISELVHRCEGVRVSTRSIIQALRPVPSERGPLQAAGEELDRETGGRWVADALAARTSDFATAGIVVVDSIRIQGQIEHLRERFGGRVRHMHLTARLDVLEARFAARKAADDPAVREFATYAEARSNPTEAAVEAMAGTADLTIDTSELTPAAVADKVLGDLGLAPER